MYDTLAFFGGGAPGLPEILVVLFVVLLLFGAKRLPELARSLGKSLSEFKKGREDGARGPGPVESAPGSVAKAQGEQAPRENDKV